MQRVRKGEDLLVILLARGWSRYKAARAAHVSEQTLYRYLKDPEFVRRVNDLRNQLMDSAVGKLIALSDMAIKRLEHLLQSKSEQVALGALREWRGCTLDFGLQHDLAIRIQEMNESNDSQPDPSTAREDEEEN